MKLILALLFGVLGTQAFGQVTRIDCDRNLSYSSDRRQCNVMIRSSRGNIEARKAMKICLENERFANEKLNCMRSVQYASFDRGALNLCEYNIVSSSAKADCVKTIANGSYDRDAVNVCASPQRDRMKVDCLRVTRNRSYDNRVERYCGDLYPDEAIIDCMQNDGRRGRRGNRGRRVRRSETVYTSPAPTYSYDRDSYLACYERPKTRIVEIRDEAQNRRGGRLVIGGLAGIIGGAIIGGDAGDIISAAGVGVAAWGAIEIADSRDVFIVDNGYDCTRYYTPDTRRYSFRRDGRNCTTTRYYSSDWTGSEEYFETTCTGRRGRRSTYMTFTRSSEIWYN